MVVLMLTGKDIGDYLTYRFKLNELIHLHFLFHALNDGSAPVICCLFEKIEYLDTTTLGQIKEGKSERAEIIRFNLRRRKLVGGEFLNHAAMGV